MLRAAGLPRASPVFGAWGSSQQKALPWLCLGSGRSWERLLSLEGQLCAQLKIPHPGSCLASSRLCGLGHSSCRAFGSPVFSFVGTSHPFALPCAKISTLAVEEHFQAAACSWFGPFIVIGAGEVFSSLFPMPTPLTSSPYQRWQSWVRYLGCCHSSYVWRKWPLSAAAERGCSPGKGSCCASHLYPSSPYWLTMEDHGCSAGPRRVTAPHCSHRPPAWPTSPRAFPVLEQEASLGQVLQLVRPTPPCE